MFDWMESEGSVRSGGERPPSFTQSRIRSSVIRERESLLAERKRTRGSKTRNSRRSWLRRAEFLEHRSAMPPVPREVLHGILPARSPTALPEVSESANPCDVPRWVLAVFGQLDERR